MFHVVDQRYRRQEDRRQLAEICQKNGSLGIPHDGLTLISVYVLFYPQRALKNQLPLL